MKKLFLFGAVIALGLTSCEKEEETQEPVKTLEGTWTIESSLIFGMTIPGDGSYLKFNGCDTECTGEDYMESDKTTGAFTYELSDDEKTLIINDEDEAGGSYDGTWTVVKYTDSELDLSIETFFGPMTLEMKK